MTWRIAHGQHLRLHIWQDECVVFNDLSGDTHLLGSAAAIVLTALRDSPAASTALAAMLATQLSLPMDDQLQEEVDGLLDELGGFSLIEIATSAERAC